MPRKGVLWTTSEISLTLAVGLVSVSDPQVTLDFRAKTGREHLKTDTVMHTWIRGLLAQSAAGDGSTEMYAFCAGWMPRAMLAANLPPVLSHNGDVPIHYSNFFQEPAAAGIVDPAQGAGHIDIESAGARSCPGAQEYDFTYWAESLNTPSAGTFALRLAVTTMWKIAG